MKIPIFKQETEYTCGPACMKMILASLNVEKSENTLSKMMNTNREYGTLHKDMIRATKKLGLTCLEFKFGKVSQIKKFLKEEWYIIVCHRDDVDDGHYSVVSNVSFFKIKLIDPYDAKIKIMGIKSFEKKWYDTEDNSPWFVAIKKFGEFKK